MGRRKKEVEDTITLDVNSMEYKYLLFKQCYYDCKYYIGHNCTDKHQLYTNNPIEQIELMNKLYDELIEQEQYRLFCSKEDIEDLEKQMI